MKYSYKNAFAVVLLLLAFAAVLLPMMSVYCSDGESGTILVRIFNLAEFGVTGFIPIAVPLLLIAAVFIRFPQKWKRLTVIGIFAIDAVCTVLAAKNAHVWLAEIGMGNVHFHSVCALYAVSVIAAVVLLVFRREHRAEAGSELPDHLDEKFKELNKQEEYMRLLLKRYDEMVASGQVLTEEQTREMEEIRRIVSHSEK